MLPPADSWTVQVTAVDWPAVVPVTVAVKAMVPPTTVLAGSGEIETVMTGVAVTVTVAVALFEGSATLFATTWNVPWLRGRCSGQRRRYFPPAPPAPTR